MENHKFIFVAGLHKSGTSILFKCLREHPQISGFKDTGVPQDEGQHLQTVYPSEKELEGKTMGEFGFKRGAYIDETSALVSKANRDRLFSEWSRYWDLDKPFLLEKSPANLLRTRFLQALFPNSYFVIITRHPIAVSFATRKHWRIVIKLNLLLKHWLYCHDTFMADRGHLKNTYLLKYEAFVENPNKHLADIYSFLGVENHPTNSDVRSDINGNYYQRWQEFQNNVVLKPYANYITAKYETRINQYGYSLTV